MPFIRRKGRFESSRVFSIPIDSIVPNPAQPRKLFDPAGLEELSRSIAAHGILQPLSVRRTGGGYELISGERRLRAARMAGLDQVPCLLVNAGDTEASLLALIENVQRRDLDFWEEALALQSLLSATGLSQEALAAELGRSQSAVANKLRLLKLPPEAVQLLRENGFTERHARALLKLEDPPAQIEAAHYIVEHDLTVAKAEAHVESLLSPSPRRSRPIYVIKDVRLFLNTLSRAMALMQRSGVQAHCLRQDSDSEILLTIRIPR